MSLRFVWSRVCVFLYSLGPWSPPRDGLSGSFIPPSLFTIQPTSPPPPVSPPAAISQIRLDQDYGERTHSEAAASSGVELRCHDDAFTGLKLGANYSYDRSVGARPVRSGLRRSVRARAVRSGLPRSVSQCAIRPFGLRSVSLCAPRPLGPRSVSLCAIRPFGPRSVSPCAPVRSGLGRSPGRDDFGIDQPIYTSVGYTSLVYPAPHGPVNSTEHYKNTHPMRQSTIVLLYCPCQ